MDNEHDPNITFFKADEVDTDGHLVPKPMPDRKPFRPPSEDAPLDTIELLQPEVTSRNPAATPKPPGRPALRREVSVPAPPQPPPPAPPPSFADAELSMDPMPITQVEDFASQMPTRGSVTPYAFEYNDYASTKDELEDYFSYSVEEQGRLLRAQEVFEERWQPFDTEGLGWERANAEARRSFVEGQKHDLVSQDRTELCSAMLCLLYLSLGCWAETARTKNVRSTDTENAGQCLENGGEPTYAEQLAAIQRNVHFISDVLGLQTIWQAACSACSTAPATGAEDSSPVNGSKDRSEQAQFASWAGKIVLYVLIDTVIREHEAGQSEPRQLLLKLQPDMLNTITDWLIDLRWDDSAGMPSCKLLILYWKTILLVFGGVQQSTSVKRSFGDEIVNETSDDRPRINASPLDYHVFRQEIISKYPSFHPPQPLFPFQPEHNSVLPSFSEIEKIDAGGVISFNNTNDSSRTGSSIIHQPVHIATPAPSPPPSPAGPGGKGIKKQNYQTNQNFPFLYPPLNELSNDIGGKGETALQDLLVGRRWSGSDVPASIIEAANLFAQRMHASRAMKQLWAERIRFIKHERGYALSEGIENKMNIETTEQKNEELNEDTQQRLRAVESYYGASVTKMQSLVVVLLKVLLQNVTSLAIQSNGAASTNGSPGSASNHDQDIQPYPANRANPVNNSQNGNPPLNPPPPPPPVKVSELSPQDFDRLRTQEIMVKAVSAILLLLLKWFKLSHILKFEYLSQLLFDSNYIPLTLKLFLHQELERVVFARRERKHLNFFEWCRASPRRHTATAHNVDNANIGAEPSGNSEAESAPTQMTQAPPNGPLPLPPPAVDELGIPITPLPAQPITSYSFTSFITIINTLRTIQKLIKSKPHRQLTMVQHKSSNILRRVLKVPQSDVRLYTLKIIKGQVPYCHRKWRQGNMRVITAIYLNCTPTLRDEWLAGCDVDQEVGEAMPQERALRALTYWYNVRRYPIEMGLPPVSEPDQALPLNGNVTNITSVVGTGTKIAADEANIESTHGDDELADVASDEDVDIDLLLDTASDDDGEDFDDLDNEDDDADSYNPNARFNSHSHHSSNRSSFSRQQPEADFFLQELAKMDLGDTVYSLLGDDGEAVAEDEELAEAEMEEQVELEMEAELEEELGGNGNGNGNGVSGAARVGVVEIQAQTQAQAEGQADGVE